MIIVQKIAFEDYLKLNYSVFYKKFSIIFTHIFGFLLLSIATIDLLLVDLVDGFPTYQLIIGTGMNLLMPLAIYHISKKNFKNHEILHGTIEYEFTESQMKISGSSFKSEFDLNTAYLISESNSWFVINPVKNSSLIIFKGSLSSKDISELRQFFGKLSGINTRLRNRDN